jgi:HAE1 family hydrophobic/amphiphilic exporter-1
MRLKPRSERKLNADQIIQELRPQFAQIPGLSVFMQNLPLIRIGGMLTKALYQFSLQDTDTKELFHWTPLLMNKIAEDKSTFQDVTSDLFIANPQVNVEIDRDKAAALGVTPEQIENALYDAYGERQSSTIYGDVAEYWVVFEVLPQFQLDPDALSQLYITSSFTLTNSTTPILVPLSAVARLTRTLGPTSISHVGQLPSVTISFNLAPGVSLGTAVERVQKIENDLHLPATIAGSFQGSAAVFQSSVKGLGLLLVASIIVIYIILGILYERFIR